MTHESSINCPGENGADYHLNAGLAGSGSDLYVSIPLFKYNIVVHVDRMCLSGTLANVNHAD